MQVGENGHTYEWIDQWARIPDNEAGRRNGRTHGVAVASDGRVVVFHQSNPAVLVFDVDGTLLHAWGDRFTTAHGLTLTCEGREEFLWLTDESTAAVVKTTLDGQVVMELDRPKHEVYESTKYIPTWVAVNQERWGGNGDIWVADGYGASFLHRFDRHGRLLASLDGHEGGAGRFNCPHGIMIDTRQDEPRLYIADRGNRRIQVYDLEGRFQWAFGQEFLTSPCGFAADGDLLIIPELKARLTVLDKNDKPITYLAGHEEICGIEGWPNHPSSLIKPGKFNSPHGAAVDAQGNIYVVEWIVGGRITKLAKCGSPVEA